MTYSRDLPAAARRHRDAADLLNLDPPRGKRDVAGYLFGIAAECALKEMMRLSGMRPTENRREDPFFMHFPHLKTALLDRAHGRNHAVLLRHANNNALLANWDVSMRYAAGPSVLQMPIEIWRSQTHALICEMEGS